MLVLVDRAWRTTAVTIGAPKEFAPTMHAPFRLVSYVIVALMAAAVLYAFYMSVTYWTGIGV